MRILLLFLLATPLHAWEFTANPVCTLSHDTDGATARVTYDPRDPQPYAIAITLIDGSWPKEPVFAIEFNGLQGLTITTDRHRLSDGGTTLTVRDTGFGNVLDGIALNSTATAVSGPIAVGFPLSGAAPEVEAFRDCTKGGLADLGGALLKAASAG